MLRQKQEEAFGKPAAVAHAHPPRAARRGFVLFAAALALLLALLFGATRPFHNGDVEEYALTTVALANHGSPDIRPADIAVFRAAHPEFAPSLAVLEAKLDGNAEVPKPGFYRGNDGAVYAIHFFAYSALAVLPYKLLSLAGIAPFKAFLAVNLAFVFVLGLALYRLFGSAQRAGLGVLLFMMCGGVLYGNWSSPETMSAAALLAALALYLTGAPLRAGLLAGVAAMHNPPIVFFAAFAPLLRLCVVYQRGAGPLANLKAALGPRELLGSAFTGLLFALHVGFNLWAFGVPSIIGKVSTAVELASLNRLHALFFDLNQGMIVGVPGLVLALLLWGWRGPRRVLAVTVVAAAFAVALAVPSLVAHNWNSAAAGMMRYAFWCAMPLLFAFLWRLRQCARWPAALVAAVLAVQVGAVATARSYNELNFSPLAHWVLARFPAAYNPDPEVFDERVAHRESWLDIHQVGLYKAHGTVTKALYNLSNANAGSAICGAGRALAEDNHFTDVDRQWRYVSAPIRCVEVTEFVAGHAALRLGSGWSGVESGGGAWNGAWSNGERARLAIAAGTRPARVVLHGFYFDGNRRTRVIVDGADLGWHELDRQPALQVPAGAGKPGLVEVELEFDAAHVPPPGRVDQRRLGFFLQKVTLH